MKKTRLEAFSDGVLAIVITLLILDVKLPAVDYDHLYGSLLKILPGIGIYVLSFLLIGMYWVFHHFAFMLIREVDGVLLWLNILFLLGISFLPFPTSLLGKYPFHTMPVVIYCINLLLVNLIGFITMIYLRRNPQLASEMLTSELHSSQMRLYTGVNLLYVLAIILAFFVPKVSCVLLAMMTVFLIIRSVVFMGIGKCNARWSGQRTAPKESTDFN